MNPFFSIISVTYNDVWALTKTTRSVFRQTFGDFEYIIIDGASTDGTQSLIDFWEKNGLVTTSISEPDSGVYNAMNKGVQLATGRYVHFLNSGDIFYDDNVLSKVHELLSEDKNDGVLGWGELNGAIWASWVGSEAFKMASLGFCHQALFVRRELLLSQPFDERTAKTDSDTLQLGNLYASQAKISIIPEVLAIRGGEPGISADLERTKISIVNTLLEEYPELNESSAEHILSFRRQCSYPTEIISLIEKSSPRLRLHLCIMVLDTLFLKQSANLKLNIVSSMYDLVTKSLKNCDGTVSYKTYIDKLLNAQKIKHSILINKANTRKKLQEETTKFRNEEKNRINQLKHSKKHIGLEGKDFIVSLTSFPARIQTLDLVVQSLVEQTCPPSEIHVWLGMDEIAGRNWLPKSLLAYENNGLRIHFAQRTFHQYDKFLHNYKINRDIPFVIVDDDVIYPPTAMENLLTLHHAYPEAVIANRCHLITVSADGAICPYESWPREAQVERPSFRAFPTGAGGVFYPPGFLSNSMVADINSILANAPYADDIWLKFCALARRVPTMTTPLSNGSNWYLRYTPTMSAGALHATNVALGLNDMQIQRCVEWLSQIKPHWRDEFLGD